ncbi:hypothetical protein RhiirA4_475561 [Rhizophagus irregularis]|uniref:Uncharacterized protein n=1 Tax=Rhizophagus irregularis TaxID=588596 RepID=A0A2I1HAF3_9GLOM|nr:hypothetical protein RhiirA4_475561 [Rhizophagus irregularis]
MTYYRIHNIYTFDTDYENLVDLTPSLDDDLDSAPLNLPYSNHSPLSPLSHPSYPSYWRPSSKLQRLYDRFQNNILSQWPRIPCVYCGKVLYPEKACWSFYNLSITYPLQQRVPNVSLSFNPNINRIPDLRIPTCESCKKPSTRFSFPYLPPLPVEITSVPMHKRRFLSLVYLHCSLGRNPNSNPYSQYRSLTGTMNYSRNIRAHALYSGTLGAFLESNEDNNDVGTFDHDETLRRAAAWLAENNPYLRPFTNLLTSDDEPHTLHDPFPRARHLLNDTDAPPVNSRDIVVPNYDFPSEVYDEDFHYSRLIAGFVRDSDNLRIPISTYDPNLEPLLFPDIFTDRKGHYHDLENYSDSVDNTRTETYGKYIKLRLMNIDPRWRLHHHWPSWSYLQLEKLRHHQNTQRLLQQSRMMNSNNDINVTLPSARELIRPSSYSSCNILDENITIPIPTFIRTGDSYFHQR